MVTLGMFIVTRGANALGELSRISGTDYPRLSGAKMYKSRVLDVNSIIITTPSKQHS